jgi:DNA recombination protein RmuC
MDVWQSVIVGVVFLVLGAAGAWLSLRGRVELHRLRAEDATTEKAAAHAELARVAEERRLADVDLAKAREQAAQADRLRVEVNDAEGKISVLEERIAQHREHEAKLSADIAAKEDALRAQAEGLKDAKRELTDVFQNLASRALGESNEAFLRLAKQRLEEMEKASQRDLSERQQSVAQLLQPVKENLERLEGFNRDLEKVREGAYEQIKTQIASLQQDQRSLAKETGMLARALQNPGTAGAWGEVALMRVVEMAGLERHVVVFEQKGHDTDEGRKIPDMLVKLPGGRTIVIDAKAPMSNYLEAVKEQGLEESVRKTLLVAHAQNVLGRARELQKKGYGEELSDTPDFTVLFIPSEGAFRAAVEAKPNLMEEAMDRNVVIASPATLLGLLRAVHYGWRQEQLAAEAKEIQKEGAVLYDRLHKLADHYQKLGKGLQSTVKAYNDFGGSLERMVLPAARRMKERGISGKEEPPAPLEVEFSPRSLQADDLIGHSVEALPGTDD